MNDDRMIRWGIVGSGRIARRFAQGLAHVPAARLGALWSRRPEPVAAFANEFGGVACPGFEALLRSEIDALYIATLQDSHVDYAIAALEAGLQVLCEKPATINAPQLERVLAAARKTQRLFSDETAVLSVVPGLARASRHRPDRSGRPRARRLFGRECAARPSIVFLRACGRRAARYRYL